MTRWRLDERRFHFEIISNSLRSSYYRDQRPLFISFKGRRQYSILSGFFSVMKQKVTNSSMSLFRANSSLDHFCWFFLLSTFDNDFFLDSLLFQKSVKSRMFQVIFSLSKMVGLRSVRFKFSFSMSTKGGA